MMLNGTKSHFYVCSTKDLNLHIIKYKGEILCFLWNWSSLSSCYIQEVALCWRESLLRVILRQLVVVHTIKADYYRLLNSPEALWHIHRWWCADVCHACLFRDQSSPTRHRGAQIYSFQYDECTYMLSPCMLFLSRARQRPCTAGFIYSLSPPHCRRLPHAEGHIFVRPRVKEVAELLADFQDKDL